jgi:hypothetical protein
MGLYLHPVLSGKDARGAEPGPALLRDLDDAEPAGGIRGKRFVIAQGGDINTHVPGYLKQGKPFLAGDFSVVDS